MTTQNPFETAESFGNSAEHNNEILTSRVGGLGGSDAALVIRAARQSLTRNDIQRLAVMLGKAAPESFGGNVHTRAGHMFEDWVAMNAADVLGRADVERERVISANLCDKFKTFAHADFFDADGCVHECKYTQDDLKTTAHKYEAQLQWYYLLGARSVCLVWGTGSKDPFLVDAVEEAYIEPDPNVQAELLQGLAYLMDFIDEFDPNESQRVAWAEAGETLCQLLERYERAAAEANEAQRKADDLKKQVFEMMQADGLQSITREEIDGVCPRLVVSTTAATTTRTFDKKALQKAYPDIDLSRFVKETPRAASITIKIGDPQK